MGNNESTSIEIYTEDNLSIDALNLAKCELNEKSNADRIVAMKELINQLEIKNVNPHKDPIVLLYFLRASKYQTMASVKKALRYYELRKNEKSLFSNINDDIGKLKNILLSGFFLPLGQNPNTKQFIFMIQVAKHDTSQFTIFDMLKAAIMIMEIFSIRNEEMSIYGINVIIDLRNVGLNHASQLSIGNIKKLMHIWQNCYPFRTKKVEFLNVPWGAHMILSFFLMCMTSKLKERVLVHNKMSSINTLCKSTGKEINENVLNHISKYWCTEVENARHALLLDQQYMAQ